MSIETTYLAKGHATNDEGDRFVMAVFPSGYAWCLRGVDRRYDIAQGTCDASDMPDDVRAAADRRRGHAFSYVEWPR